MTKLTEPHKIRTENNHQGDESKLFIDWHIKISNIAGASLVVKTNGAGQCDGSYDVGLVEYPQVKSTKARYQFTVCQIMSQTG